MAFFITTKGVVKIEVVWEDEMKRLFTPQISLNNRIFKRLFVSYILIIILCFLAYSGIVIYETVTMKREQLGKLYDVKLQEMIFQMDNQITKARNIASGINNSYLVRRFYMSAFQEKSVDAYLLYQLLNELQLEKASSESFYIYDVALFFDHYNKAYTGGSVILLNGTKEDGTAGIEKEGGEEFFRVTTLNQLAGLKNPEMLFYKEFLIYHSPFRYTSGPSKGSSCVLLDAKGLTSLLDQLVGEDGGWAVLWNDQPILNGGRQDGVTFGSHSRSVTGLSYKVFADPKEFWLSADAIWTVALAAGLVVCVCYMILAYVFAYRYYKPLGYINQLIRKRGVAGKTETGVKKRREDDLENDMNRIVIEVENLVDERDNYKEHMITISPYVEKGIFHSLLSGNWDKEAAEMQALKEYMKLEKMYLLAAAISLFYTGRGVCEKNEIRRVKEILIEKAETCSDETVRIYCYEQEPMLFYLIINSDTGEKIEDLLYDCFAEIQNAVEEEGYVVTMGADEVREQVAHLDEAWIHSKAALRGMLTGGRGSIYFYEEDDRTDYYFPTDAVRILAKMIKEKNQEGLETFLDTLADKNTKERDLSLTAIGLLEDELYMSTVKAVRTAATMFTLSIQIAKPGTAMTFEELKEYYSQVYGTVLQQIPEKPEEECGPGQTEQEIFQYVDEHYTDEDISLTDITERFHVSNKYVSYVFKRQFGITYLQYVQEKRIAYAVRLLKTTDDTLEKIASACGYSNLLTFRRNFKAIMNVNPSDFPRES